MFPNAALTVAAHSPARMSPAILRALQAADTMAGAVMATLARLQPVRTNPESVMSSTRRAFLTAAPGALAVVSGLASPALVLQMLREEVGGSLPGELSRLRIVFEVGQVL